MEVIFEKQTSVEGKIKINLTQEDYHEKVETEIKNYAKKAQLKGFRPGKVPPSYIKKLHGESFTVQIVSQIVDEQIRKYINENKIKTLGAPIIDESSSNAIDWSNPIDLSFIYNIGFVDSESINIDQAVSITDYIVTVGDTEVDETIKRAQKQMTTHESQEIVDNESEVKGKILFDDKSFPSLYFSPSVLDSKSSKNFIGKKKEETLDITVSKSKITDVFLEILGEQVDAKDFPTTVSFKIEDIGLPKPPEINEEFFKMIFPKEEIKDEAAFREEIQKMLQIEFSKDTKKIMEQELIEEYIKTVNPKLPEEFLRKLLLQSNEKIDEKYLETNFEHHLRNTQWDVLIETILENNEMQIEKEHVEEKAKAFIKEQLGAYGMAEVPEEEMRGWINRYLYQKEGQEDTQKGEMNENYMKLFDELRNDKALEYIKSKANIKSEKVDKDQFIELLKEKQK